MVFLKRIAAKGIERAIVQCSFAILALVLATIVCHRLQVNLTTASLLYVVAIVLLSRFGDFVPSIIASVFAALCLAYIAPPSYSFRVNDPLDVLAILVFFLVSFVIARLVSTLRRMKEEALSSVSRALIDAEERERARIARDLGQRLAMLAIRFEQLGTDAPDETAEDPITTDRLAKELDDISHDIQALSHSLHSPKLEYLGLARAARSFCRESGSQYNVEIDFRNQELQKALPPDVSLSLFRVLQEALHNSAKHSGTRQINVELFETRDTIELIVRDSGRGFKLEAAMKEKGLGLISMQERTKLVKGKLSIDSQPNRGTTIHARVPIMSSGSSANTAVQEASELNGAPGQVESRSRSTGRQRSSDRFIR